MGKFTFTTRRVYEAQAQAQQQAEGGVETHEEQTRYQCSWARNRRMELAGSRHVHATQNGIERDQYFAYLDSQVIETLRTLSTYTINRNDTAKCHNALHPWIAKCTAPIGRVHFGGIPSVSSPFQMLHSFIHSFIQFVVVCLFLPVCCGLSLSSCLACALRFVCFAPSLCGVTPPPHHHTHLLVTYH